MFLKKVTLKLKLLASFGIFAAIALCVGGVGYNSLHDVSAIYGVISSEAAPSLNRFYTMNLIGSKMQDAMQGVFLNFDAPDIVLDQVANFKTLKDELESIRLVEEKRHSAGSMFDAMKNVSETWKNIGTHSDSILKLVESGDLNDKSAALRLFSTEYTREMNTLKKHLNEILELQNKTVTHQTEQAEALVKSRNKIIAGLLALGILVALFVGYLIARSLGFLVYSVEKVTANLIGGSERLSGSASELLSASQELASGASEGAASLEETAASLEELSSMVKVNASSATEAANLSQQSSESASESEAQIQKLTSAMNEMKESSKRISEIIDVIDDIAFQTNLLALNAAVEAARAGEQGRGFAVVADAVRSLAQRSASAAKDINSLIKENMQSTEQGGNIVEQSGVAFNSIISLIKRVAILNGEIASASRSQAEGLSQINISMAQLETIMQSSSSSAEKAADSSLRLTNEAQAIRETVNHLNLVISGSVVEHVDSEQKQMSDDGDNSHNVVPLTGS